MNPPPTLAGAHLRTFRTIFQHPVSHNLGWREVRALLRQMGEVEEEANGNFKVTRHGQTLVLPPARAKDVGETDELMQIRHFLQRSEQPEAAAGHPEARWLLVINHQRARIFRSEAPGTVAEEILPHEGHFRPAPDAKDFTRGQEKPDPNSFFELVARALKDVRSMLLFGSGTGTASERDQFKAWLNAHHPELARRIDGSVTVDEHHVTDAQLLAKARNFAPAHSP
jgi:hypothetical protein